jgi:hypothetical protein
MCACAVLQQRRASVQLPDTPSANTVAHTEPNTVTDLIAYTVSCVTDAVSDTVTNSITDAVTDTIPQFEPIDATNTITHTVSHTIPNSLAHTFSNNVANTVANPLTHAVANTDPNTITDPIPNAESNTVTDPVTDPISNTITEFGPHFAAVLHWKQRLVLAGGSVWALPSRLSCGGVQPLLRRRRARHDVHWTNHCQHGSLGLSGMPRMRKLVPLYHLERSRRVLCASRHRRLHRPQQHCRPNQLQLPGRLHVATNAATNCTHISAHSATDVCADCGSNTLAGRGCCDASVLHWKQQLGIHVRKMLDLQPSGIQRKLWQ